MGKDYIKWIRGKVGHDLIFLNFVGGVIRDREGRILLQRRADKNKWGFPGGAMELGESATQTAIREIKEETGLDVEVTKLIGIYTDYYDEYPNGDQAQTIAIFLEFAVVGGEFINSNEETLELHYFALTEFPELVNQQHKDAFDDIKNGRYGVLR